MSGFTQEITIALELCGYVLERLEAAQGGEEFLVEGIAVVNERWDVMVKVREPNRLVALRSCTLFGCPSHQELEMMRFILGVNAQLLFGRLDFDTDAKGVRLHTSIIVPHGMSPGRQLFDVGMKNFRIFECLLTGIEIVALHNGTAQDGMNAIKDELTERRDAVPDDGLLDGDDLHFLFSGSLAS